MGKKSDYKYWIKKQFSLLNYQRKLLFIIQMDLAFVLRKLSFVQNNWSL
jgi:hypothetical protein